MGKPDQSFQARKERHFSHFNKVMGRHQLPGCARGRLCCGGNVAKLAVSQQASLMLRRRRSQPGCCSASSCGLHRRKVVVPSIRLYSAVHCRLARRAPRTRQSSEKPRTRTPCLRAKLVMNCCARRGTSSRRSQQRQHMVMGTTLRRKKRSLAKFLALRRCLRGGGWWWR